MTWKAKKMRDGKKKSKKSFLAIFSDDGDWVTMMVTRGDENGDYAIHTIRHYVFLAKVAIRRVLLLLQTIYQFSVKMKNLWCCWWWQECNNISRSRRNQKLNTFPRKTFFFQRCSTWVVSFYNFCNLFSKVSFPCLRWQDCFAVGWCYKSSHYETQALSPQIHAKSHGFSSKYNWI